jgi:hypothetical protein
MPSISTVLRITSALVLLAAIAYQVVPKINFPEPFVVKVIRQLFLDTKCYISVTTLSSRIPHAECISIGRDGRFTKVFLDETSYPYIKEQRKGHVIPGFWDGHGHLLQYGELMNSANLFGAKSMKEIKERLVAYKSSNEEAGTREQWLRGIGWDQANFGGKWPVSVSLQA